jgi:hypothetical protein
MLDQQLDFVLGSPGRVRVLRALAGLEHGVSGPAVARRARASPRVLSALAELVAAGIVECEHAQGRHTYALNRRHVLAQPLARLFSSERTWLGSLRDALDGALAPGTLGNRTEVLSVALTWRGSELRPLPTEAVELLVLVAGVAGPARRTLVPVAASLRLTHGLLIRPRVLTVQQWQRLRTGTAPAAPEPQSLLLLRGRPPGQVGDPAGERPPARISSRARRSRAGTPAPGR